MIRIGTRDSQLAVWQAKTVQQYFSDNGLASELVFINSSADTDLITPLYAMGVQGVFSKALDAALLNNRIDIAVHSMKDVPVQLAEGLAQAAVLVRASTLDLLLYKDSANFFNDLNAKGIIATGSLRRQAQWLNRYPDYTVENLRGNVITRMQKLEKSQWNGAIFAAAGLERIGKRPEKVLELDWMLPAPAQGAILVVCRQQDETLLDTCAGMNHAETAICVKAERDFLKTLEGGCSAPIGALATIEGEHVFFKGNICSVDGLHKTEITLEIPMHKANNIGHIAAANLLAKGGPAITTLKK